MAIYKHSKSQVWFVSVVDASGKRIRHSTKTRDKKAAQEYHDKLCASFWRQTQLDEPPQYTFAQAALLYLQSLQGRSNYRNAREHVKYWREHFADVPIRSLTSDMIERATPTRTRLPYGAQRDTSPATKNRFLATMSKILNDSVKRGWIDRAPYIQKHRERNVRESFMTKDEARRLVECMPVGWMRDVTEFAFATGMRRGEILSLEWSEVNLDQRFVSVLSAKAKSGQGRPVPLNSCAVDVIRRRVGKHPRYVFTARHKRTYDIDRRVFVQALMDARLSSSFRFHDCRHSWASWMAQAGTPMLTLQRLGGWKTLSMLNRYAHLSIDDLQQYASTCEFFTHPTTKKNALIDG